MNKSIKHTLYEILHMDSFIGLYGILHMDSFIGLSIRSFNSPYLLNVLTRRIVIGGRKSSKKKQITSSDVHFPPYLPNFHQRRSEVGGVLVGEKQNREKEKNSKDVASESNTGRSTIGEVHHCIQCDDGAR